MASFIRPYKTKKSIIFSSFDKKNKKWLKIYLQWQKISESGPNQYPNLKKNKNSHLNSSINLLKQILQMKCQITPNLSTVPNFMV